MDQQMLGRTGVPVSKLCLGAMMFGAWGESDHDQSIRTIHAALDAGINFIDTADVYSAGESEVIVGKALADGRRDRVFLATKVGFPIGDDPHQRGTSRRRIIRGIEDSLRRLGTDWIDLYQIHRPDPNTDIDETLGALTDLVHQGKIRYFGHSTLAASEIVQAQWTARDRGYLPFRCEQPPYSILTRNIEHDVLPTCEHYGMGVIPYSPLAGGWLSGRYRKNADSEGPHSAARPQARFDMSDPANQRKFDAADQLAQLADEAGITLIELALAFVLRHPAVTAAIIGPRTMDHLHPSCPPPKSSSPTKSWTGSTRSSRRAPRSTSPTTAGPSPPLPPPIDVAERNDHMSLPTRNLGSLQGASVPAVCRTSVVGTADRSVTSTAIRKSPPRSSHHCWTGTGGRR